MTQQEQSPIRIMRIIARMNVGGPAVQVTGLMRGISSIDFDQRLFTGFCEADEADYLESVAPDVPVIRIASLGRHVSLGDDIKAFISLVNAIRDFKPQIIHTHTAKAGFLGRIASIVSLHSAIRVHTFHGHLLSGYFGNFKRSLVVIAEKSLAFITDQLLAVGDKVRQDLIDVGVGTSEKFAIMPPGLGIDALPRKDLSKESLGLSASGLHCAFIGRVTKIKRPDRFLDVVSEIKKRGVNLEFFIAGDGELMEMCKKRIVFEDLPVTVLGWQSDIEKILSAADIVLLTSDNEGTPISLIQAGMAGLPVVTTNVGSVSEVILDGITGVVTALDVQEIANALEGLVADIDLRVKFGDAAKEFTLANFGLQRLVRNHEELYKKLLSNPTKS